MTETEKKKPMKMDDVREKAEQKNCPVQKSLVYVETFLSEPMCGKCFPCSMGSYEARVRLNSISGRDGSDQDIERVIRIAGEMAVASMCKKGKDTAAYLKEQLESGEFSAHVTGVCSDGECKSCFTYVIIPEECTLCGDCLDVCKDNAIIGEKKKPYRSGYLPFEIAQKRCTKCGECMKVCKFDAVKIVSVKEMTGEEVGAK